MRYEVAQDVSLRAIGGMIAGNVERTLLWLVVGVYCKQIISHGRYAVYLGTEAQEAKEKVAPEYGSLGTVHPMRVPDDLVYTSVYEIGWRMVYRVAPVSLTATVSELCRLLPGYFFFFGADTECAYTGTHTLRGIVTEGSPCTL